MSAEITETALISRHVKDNVPAVFKRTRRRAYALVFKYGYIRAYGGAVVIDVDLTVISGRPFITPDAAGAVLYDTVQEIIEQSESLISSYTVFPLKRFRVSVINADFAAASFCIIRVEKIPQTFFLTVRCDLRVGIKYPVHNVVRRLKPHFLFFGRRKLFGFFHFAAHVNKTPLIVTALLDVFVPCVFHYAAERIFIVYKFCYTVSGYDRFFVFI